MPTLHDSPYVLNNFLDQFPQLVMSRGGDLAKLCQAAGLSVVEVTGPTQLIAFDRFIGLLEHSAVELGVDDFALQLAARQNLRALGPVSMMIRHCQDFTEALQTIIKYLRLVVSGIDMQVEVDAQSLTVEIHTSLPALQERQQFQDYLVGSSVAILRDLSGQRFSLTRCQLDQFEPDPAKRRALTEFMGCPPQFGHRPTRLSFDAALLHTALNFSSVQTLAVTSDIKAARQNLEQSVTDALLYVMLMDKPSIKQVAPMLGYSERTLRRRLSDMSLSFGDILDATRMTQANKYLQSTHYRLNDIANLLGFANQSAFTRSYIRCSGITPSRYRQLLTQSAANQQ